MPAHGQAAAGFDEEHRNVVLRIVWRVEDAPAHHVVPPGFKHKAFADPVEFAEEMLSFLTHAVAGEYGAALFHQAYRISAGMGVDAMENVQTFIALLVTDKEISELEDKIKFDAAFSMDKQLFCC
jgi:hypothetical protein